LARSDVNATGKVMATGTIHKLASLLIVIALSLPPARAEVGGQVSAGLRLGAAF